MDNSIRSRTELVREVSALAHRKINWLKVDIFPSCNLLLNFIMPTSTTDLKRRVVWNCLCRPVVRKRESF